MVLNSPFVRHGNHRTENPDVSVVNSRVPPTIGWTLHLDHFQSNTNWGCLLARRNLGARQNNCFIQGAEAPCSHTTNSKSGEEDDQ